MDKWPRSRVLAVLAVSGLVVVLLIVALTADRFRHRATQPAPATDAIATQPDEAYPSGGGSSTSGAGTSPTGDASDGPDAASGNAGESPGEGTVRFLRSALASTSHGDAITMSVLVDAPAPHLVVTVPGGRHGQDATAPSLRVRVVDQKLRPHPALEARPVDRPKGIVAGDGEARQYFFELAGLASLPNDPRRTYKGYVEAAGDGWEVRVPFRPAFRLYHAGVSVGFDASDKQWHVNASAKLTDVRGIRSLSIRLFRGATELDVEFSELRVGKHELSDVLGKDVVFADDMIWASGVGQKELGEARDLVAVFDLETMDDRQLTTTWRKAEDE